MGVLKPKQLAYLKSHELCRLATASKKAKPHVVPVIYAVDGEDVVIAVDYKTRKLANLLENPKAALVVDEFRPGPNGGLMIEGDCEVFERGKEYLRLLKVLFDRFDYYRNNPWGEGESPILKVKPSKAVSW
ncbi:MAG TPA: pyridoxamine 5'-phosphate oxidase family protein [Nitrososphaerales archaeon]|nr:pyridoxamine 5'-phosphate oxidase family protein [Nitrososphaerales archaeon]